MNATTYYVTRAKSGGGLELRQTRFRDTPDHPHDVCAVASTVTQMQETIAGLKGSVDWSQIITQATLPKTPASTIPNCPNCNGEREQNGRGGFICYFCGAEENR